MGKAEEQKHSRYVSFVKRTEPRTSIAQTLFSAFVFGGAVCMLGQLIIDLSMMLPNIDEQTAKLISTTTLVGLAILLTGIGVFDDIAHFAGCGIVIPITGFANAMASTSIEFKSEGFIFGLGTKMFNVAGPVIVNGVVWATLAGLLHYLYYLIF